MSEFPVTDKNRVRRMPARGSYDKQAVFAVIDAARICHVSFESDGQPYILPISFARNGDEIYFHGSHGNRLLNHIAAGKAVCMAFTHLDGIVLARSAFHHSVNYRSVVAFGSGRAVTDDAEKTVALKAIVEHLVPGRWDEVRAPDAKELAATMVVSVTIENASLKSRTGPPVDSEEDYDLPFWAGVVPIVDAAGDPVPDPRLAEGIPLPRSLGSS